jgi:hypothetical protein
LTRSRCNSAILIPVTVEEGEEEALGTLCLREDATRPVRGGGVNHPRPEHLQAGSGASAQGADRDRTAPDRHGFAAVVLLTGAETFSLRAVEISNAAEQNRFGREQFRIAAEQRSTAAEWNCTAPVENRSAAEWNRTAPSEKRSAAERS